MSAIINNSFRKFNADNFISAFGSNSIYLMIGKNTPWSGNSAGEYADGSYSDTNVPIPLDTGVAPFIHHDARIAAKLVPQTDVSHVLKRVDWTTGTVYPEYNHLQDDIIDTDFFVFTSAYRVYKCISNNGGVPSTVEPTGVSTDIIDTVPDGYRWKFMYEVQQSDVLKFITTDWIPVKSPGVAGTDQANVETVAVDGALDHIDVLSGGTNYKYNTGTAAGGGATTITLDASASTVDDYYNDMQIFILTGPGNGEIKTITDYVGASKEATVAAWTTAPDATSTYSVAPTVTLASSDGTSAVARVGGVTNGAITSIVMVSVGSLYRSVTCTVTSGGGSAASLIGRIGPKGGHGKDAVAELGGAFVMLNIRLIGNDGNDFPVGDDFRKVHLLVNPTTGNTTPPTLATGTTYDSTEIDEDSGKIIYTEFRAPISRASDSTEDIKIVAEF